MTDRLKLALAAFNTLRTPSRIFKAILEEGTQKLEDEYLNLPREVRTGIDQKALDMRLEGIGVYIYGTPDFPERLLEGRKPIAPIIFFRGNKELLQKRGVGMCGSRHASPRGLEAASRCGILATDKDMTVVSGYAAGVDTATHLAALNNGGCTILVLAEGIDHFRIKRAYAKEFDWERVLVLSQFAPSQPWKAHAAMARNAIIYGIPDLLLVIEAGEKGGTLAAGEAAIRRGKPVIAVDFGDDTPTGNRVLIGQGALAVRTPPQLREAIDSARSLDRENRPPMLF